MAGARLDAEQQAVLLGELEVAMQQLFDTSGSADMVALFLKDTARIRGEFLSPEPDRPTPVMSNRLGAMRRPMRSKYCALASWRFNVLWHCVRDAVDQDLLVGMNVIYFTPCEVDDPPYSWSKHSGRAPGAPSDVAPNQLDDWARFVCWKTIEHLRVTADSLGQPPLKVPAEVRAALTLRGTRRTLRDVLKLEDYWTKNANR